MVDSASVNGTPLRPPLLLAAALAFATAAALETIGVVVLIEAEGGRRRGLILMCLPAEVVPVDADTGAVEGATERMDAEVVAGEEARPAPVA